MWYRAWGDENAAKLNAVAARWLDKEYCFRVEHINFYIRTRK